MLKSGWNAHKLNAPGKFLISAPEHDIPRRARAYLVTDEMVAETSARHSRIPRRLDEISRNAMLNAPVRPAPEFQPEYENTEDAPAVVTGEIQPAPEEILWAALSAAPPEGISIADLAFACRRTRRWVYYRLQEHAQAGRVGSRCSAATGGPPAPPATGSHRERERERASRLHA
jgi:hypothetical protein